MMRAGLAARAIAVALACTVGAPALAQSEAACQSAYTKGDADAQIRLYTTCIEGGLARSNRAGAYNNRGVAYMDIGDFDHAFSDFSRVIELADQPRLHEFKGMASFNRGLIYLDRGEHALAYADFEVAARDARPDVRPEAFALMGRLRAREGDYAGAIEHFDRGLRFGRRYIEPRLAKAWLLATCPDPAFRDGEEAVELAERALRREDSARVRDTLAAAYAEAGRFEDAEREQGLAIDMLDGEPNPGLLARLMLYAGGRAYHEGAPDG